MRKAAINQAADNADTQRRLHELLGALGSGQIGVAAFWRYMREAGLTDADIDRYCLEEATNHTAHWRDVFRDSLSLTQGRPLVRVCSAGSNVPAARVSVRPTLAGQLPWCDQISTLAKNQIYTFSEHTCAHRQSLGSGKLFGDWGFESPKDRSCYEYHPLGRSKKVRTAVGRQICAAGAGALVRKERPARRGSQSQKEKPRG